MIEVLTANKIAPSWREITLLKLLNRWKTLSNHAQLKKLLYQKLIAIADSWLPLAFHCNHYCFLEMI